MESEKIKILGIRDLAVTLKDDKQVNYGSFDIYLGDFVLLKGNNGSGKSTFMKLFYPEDRNLINKGISGEIVYLEQGFKTSILGKYKQKDIEAFKRHTVYIEQEDSFAPGDSAYKVLKNMAYTAIMAESLSKEEQNKKKEQLENKIEEWYENFICKEIYNERENASSIEKIKNKIRFKWGPLKYSGGQRKIIYVLSGLLKALICDCKIVLMDEPLNNLDCKNKGVISAAVDDLRKAKDIAIIMITHCQIFEGINKVIEIQKIDDRLNKAEMREEKPDFHSECIEEHQNKLSMKL